MHTNTQTHTQALGPSLGDEITYTHTHNYAQISGGSLLEWTGLCEITGKRSLTGSAGPLLNCSEDYITLEWDKRLHTRRMGGGHQTRLCPDCARSNPAEGSADFPQARCHFSLNNSYEESNSSSAFVPIFGASLRFSPSYPVFFFPILLLPILLSCFLDCCCTKPHDVMIGILQNRLTSCGAPLAGGCFSTMNGEGGPSGEILATVVGRFGLECNMDLRRSHLMLRKHLAPCVICWTCLQSEASLISRNKQCKQMLCVCSFWTS